MVTEHGQRRQQERNAFGEVENDLTVHLCQRLGTDGSVRGVQ